MPPEFAGSPQHRGFAMLGVLHEITERMSRARPAYTTQESLDFLVKRAADITEARACTLRIFDPRKGVLSLQASHGMSRHYREKPPLKIGESIAGEVFRRGSAIAVPDINDEPRYAYRDFAASEHVASLLSAPLLGSNGPRGTLTVYYSRPHEYDQADLQFFTILANVLSIAMECAEMYTKLTTHYLDTVSAFVQAMEEKHPSTRGHSERVARYAVMIAQEMGLSEDESQLLDTVCRLHDLGKLTVDLSILEKKTILDREDFELLKRHPVAGAAILAPIRALQPHLNLVRSHHERLDGRGYPEGLSGEAIDRLTRIITVADAYDAMTSERPYSPAFPDERARRELEFGTHTQFDPDVVDALLRALARQKSRDKQAARARTARRSSRKGWLARA
ncbi:MAG: HD domain-containing phosphohydrolase [Armatimonadota bacterium]